MAKQKLTIFQKLGRVLKDEASNPLYNIDPNSFNNLSPDDLKNKELEAQQTIYLQNQWKKIDSELYQKAVYYEPTRMASYFDYEAMEYCLHGDTKIATLDGLITIKELAEKGKDYEFFTYAYDYNLKKVVPAKARNAHYTRDEMTYKVTFDDGKFIIGTWEHRLMKRDGTFTPIAELKVGDSMMPFYRKSFYNNNNYNWVYVCNSNEGHHGWIAEHNLVAEWFYGTQIKENEEVHHIDFCGKNNLPENLKIMSVNEHRSYHAKLNNEKLWSNPEYRAKMLEVSKRTDNKHHWNGERSGDKNPAYKHLPFDLIIEAAKREKTLKRTAALLNVSYRKIQREIVNAGYGDWLTFLEAYGIQKSKYATATAKEEKLVFNHKIVSIEPYGVVPVYDLTVPGYKNFATDSIFSHNTPEISVALDIFADEATTSNEHGNILSIYSESNRIKQELTHLFENVLDINTNLTSWARNLCKYGDNFVYNKIIPSEGIVGCMQLPNIEITRTEPGFTQVRTFDDFQDERVTKFHWKDKNITFNSFEVSHFRLLFDDRKLPYGTSLLEKVRRIWKQLLLAEDAMLVYRTTRAPERRVYKIFVGNMDDKDVDAYVDKIANNFKRVNTINNENGQQDTRFNAMPVWYKTPIPLLDGRTITIEELSKEYEEGKENWVYSIQDETHNIVPGKVKWCGKNYTAEKLVKVWLDDDTWIMTAPEHPFIMRNGEKKRADELQPNDSLMPFYTKKSCKVDGMRIINYNMVYNPSTGEYVFTHRIMGEEILYEEKINVKENTNLHKEHDKIRKTTKNHKVKHIEILENQNEDVYCMTVVGQNGEEDRHNFAVKSFKNDGEISVSGCVLGNSVDQDYFIPVRDPSLNMPIETLPGACISLDTRIPLLDGRTLELSEIINEWDNGDRNLWVYSCDPKTGAVAPGMITWAGITRKNTDVIKITLDNGKEIITTPDHNFVHRTKGFVEAQNLVVGDSLMPFYRKEEQIKKKTNPYEQVWDNKKQEWIFTHRMVVNNLNKQNIIKRFIFDETTQKNKQQIIHHQDFNRYNNNPSNLVFMNGSDHMLYHQKHIKDTIWADPENNKKKISIGLKKYLNSLNEEEQIKRHERINNPISKAKTTKKLLEWNKDENNLKLKGKKISLAYTDERKNQLVKRNIENWKKQEFKDKIFTKKQTITFTNELYDIFVKEFEKTLRADITLNTLNNNESFMEIFSSNNKDIRSSLTNLNKFTQNHIEKMVKQRGFKNFTEWKKNECKERGYINIRQWKYNVDKNKLYNHKIAKIEWLNDKIDTGTITVDGNELYHNYHTFAIENEIFIKNSNLSEIEDIEYIQKKLLAALRVPKAFLGFDEATGEGKNLAILDIRFARAVHRIQKALIQELNKMAIIHLYLKGFEDELNNFTLSLTTPSTQADLLKIQNWKEKVQLYKEAVSDAGNGFGAMSMTRAQKEFLGMSEDEIKLDIQRQVIEKAANEEFLMLGSVIKQTGVFRDIYKLYDINPDNMEANTNQANEEGGEAPMGGGGGFDTGGFDTGGGDIGGGDNFGGTPEGLEPGAVPAGGEEDIATDFTPDINLDDEDNNLSESRVIQKNKYNTIVNDKSNKLTKAMLKIIEEIDQNTK